MAMKKHYYCFEPSEFKDLLLAFSEQVDKRNYYKLDYSLWRAMKNYQSFVDVEWFEFDKGDKIKIVLHLNGNECIAVFNDDCSFGEYLYTEWLFDIELTQHDPYGLRSKTLSYDLNNYPGVEILGVTGSPGYIADDDGYLTDYHVHCLESRIDEVSKTMDEIIMSTSPMKNNNTENKKENNNMKFNFDFGPVNPGTVHMSIYGLAIKNRAGTWVAFDSATKNIVDVEVLNFTNADKFMYKMPVAIKDIAVGDVIAHLGLPMFVVGIAADNKALTAVDIYTGERKEIMLTQSPFGFNFATKIVNLLGNMTGTVNADNPFGNMWMLMMMGDNKDMKDMLPMLMMANGGMDMSNPMMLYALMGDSKSNDMLPWLMMMNANKPAAPAHVCNCGGTHTTGESGCCGHCDGHAHN